MGIHTTAAKPLKLFRRVSIWNEKSRGTRLSNPVLFYRKRRIKLSYFLFKCKVNIFIFIQRTRQTGTLETYWNNLLTIFFGGGTRLERERFVLLPISALLCNSWETVFKTIHISQLHHKESLVKVLHVVHKSEIEENQ